jgi:hypothetical protein
VNLRADAVLIVTHATAFHDARFSTKRGVDEAVRFAKRRRIPVIYLQDDSPEDLYFMDDCQPDHWKILPQYARTLPADFRVELQLNDSVVKVLNPARGWYPPTLRFHFVDSAINLFASPAIHAD